MSNVQPKIQSMRAPGQLQIRDLVGIVMIATGAQISSGAQETVVLPERPKVAIIANDVTVDGKARPDIAQALADSLSAGLLKAGDYRVFQTETMAPRAGKGKKGEMMLGSSSSGGSKVASDVDIKFTFNLVGQDDDYRFTLKKIRADDNEVIEVHEIDTRGKLDKVFGLVPNVLMKMQAKTRLIAPVFPQTQSPAQLKAPAATPTPQPAVSVAPAGSGNSTYWASNADLPPEYANIDFSKVPKALVYQQIGSVQFINEAWKFCIIRPQGNVKLKMSDGLHILYDEDGKIYADLKIANFDSGRVIADFGNRTPGYHKIFPGDQVFGWAPPAP
jgi:hypothetical protein